MSKTLIATVQVKSGTSQQWSALDPVLLDGEIGFDSALNQIRIGNGVARWSQLDPISGSGSDVEVVDNLRTPDPSRALSANQGYVLEHSKMSADAPFKTINGQSVRGRGNIVIAGEGQFITVVDALDSSDPDAALSANQGRVLNGLIGQVLDSLEGKASVDYVDAQVATRATQADIDAAIEPLASQEGLDTVQYTALTAQSVAERARGEITSLTIAMNQNVKSLRSADNILDTRVNGISTLVRTLESSVQTALDDSAAALEAATTADSAARYATTRADAAGMQAQTADLRSLEAMNAVGSLQVTVQQVRGEIPHRTSQLSNDTGFISQIKTINNKSLIGEGNIEIGGGGEAVNIDTAWPATPSDDAVPSTRLVKTSLDAKADSSKYVELEIKTISGSYQTIQAIIK